MDFKELSSFVAVVNYGNFSKAAEKLFVSQPTISQHIKLLEDELNTKLFKRSTKHLSVTNEGKILYDFSVKVLKLKNDFNNKWDKGIDKTIKIGASSIPSAYLLPELISKFKSKYPDVEFDIIQGDSLEVIDMLKESVIEVGLIGMDINDKKIISKPFYKDKMVIITPNNPHFKKLKDSKTDLKTLLTENYILREEGSGTKAAGDELLSSRGIDSNNLNIVARVKSQESLINLVKNGIGISIVSKISITQSEKDGELLTFDISNSANDRNLNIIYIDQKNIKKVLKNFISFTKSYFK